MMHATTPEGTHACCKQTHYSDSILQQHDACSMPDMLTATNDAKLMLQQQKDVMQAASGMLHAECLVQGMLHATNPAAVAPRLR